MNSVPAIEKYHTLTRGYLYSYLACIPLLILYEVLIRITQPDTGYMVRISVDVWLRQLFRFAGLNALSAILFLALITGAVILYKNKKDLREVKRSYFMWMAAESLLYALFIGLSIQVVLDALLMMSTTPVMMSTTPGLDLLNKWQMFALSLGAGLYEELFFRVILVSLLLYLFQQFTRNKNYVRALAIITAALIFSAVHYTGSMGDVFTLHSFLFRFVFGLALNLIYVARGFGIAAWTHAIYDVIVVLAL